MCENAIMKPISVYRKYMLIKYFKKRDLLSAQMIILRKLLLHAKYSFFV